MKALVISKPIYEYIIPLVEFPQDGDKFYINESIKTVNSIGTVVSVLLAKYGIDTSFTGMIGPDEYGNKIKEFFNSHNVENENIETSYEEHTCLNYKIYNSKTNKFTSITENSLKKNLLKYKYEFTPDVIVMDDGDYSANMAAINNYPNANLIYISEKFTKESNAYLNKCKYVISTLDFASKATGVVNDLNKPKNIVTLFQKYIDLYQSNLIIRLNNFDFLYLVNDEVRLIKNVNKNITNKEYIYYSLLVYFLINTNNIEESIKYTNKAMMDSHSELDMIKNIPDYKIIKPLLDELNKKIEETKTIDDNQLNNSNKIELDKNVKESVNNLDNKIETLESSIDNNKDIKPVEVISIDNNIPNQNVSNSNIEMPTLDNKQGDNIEKL